MRPGFLLIGEIKLISPTGWRSPLSLEEQFALANCPQCTMISIHTDSRWGGSLELLRWAAEHTDKPVLAKGLHPHDHMITQALGLGASYVLVVGRVPAIHRHRCFLEPTSLEQLRQLPPDATVVWNSRDLSYLPVERCKTETFEQARAIHPGRLIQASGLRRASDVHPAADGALVGTNLSEFLDTY